MHCDNGMAMFKYGQNKQYQMSKFALCIKEAEYFIFFYFTVMAKVLI